jgi:hypothetical protein
MPRFRRYGYMWRPNQSEWDDILMGAGRENAEKMLFDNTLNSGTLSGLEVQAQSAPNLTVKVKAGRGCWRDLSTGKATMIELFADLNVNLAAYVPTTVPTTYLIVAEPLLVAGLPITPPNAPVGQEDYDAAYTPTTFNSQERDESVISVVTARSGQQIVLAVVKMVVGQLQVLNTQIDTATRDTASNLLIVQKIRTDLDDLTSKTNTNTADIGSLQKTQESHSKRITAVESRVSLGKSMVFLGAMPGFAGGAGNTLTRVYSEVGAGVDIITAEQVVGSVAGAGIDFVLPNLASVPDGITTIILNSFLLAYAYGEAALFFGNVADITTLPPVTAIPSSKDGASTAQGVSPLVFVDITPAKTFKVRATANGVNTLAAETFAWKATLLGWLVG